MKRRNQFLLVFACTWAAVFGLLGFDLVYGEFISLFAASKANVEDSALSKVSSLFTAFPLSVPEDPATLDGPSRVEVIAINLTLSSLAAALLVSGTVAAFVALPRQR